MRIVNLVENTPGAPGCGAAHGLCFYIETPKHRLLMDTGPSDLLVRNAGALGIDLAAVDTVVISHGHYDHADGLPAFVALNPRAPVYLRRGAEAGYYSTADGTLHYIGMDPAIARLDQLVWVDGGMRIDGELSLFTGISGRRSWPEGNRKLMRQLGPQSEEYVQDLFDHEQCLVIEADGLRVLLSGCAHNGILNILDRFAELYGGAPDVVISGFHMKKRGDYDAAEWHTIEDTARDLLSWPTDFYTCHCTSLPAYDRMKSIMGDQLHYVHCGEALELVGQGPAPQLPTRKG